MQISCPSCGNRDVRVSQQKNLREMLQGLLGTFQLRCRRCNARWSTSMWARQSWRYARCPKCYRQELSTWSTQYYSPPGWISFILKLGATPYRCAACRCNFASFKKCKERFAWRYEERPASPIPAEASAKTHQESAPEQPSET